MSDKIRPKIYQLAAIYLNLQKKIILKKKSLRRSKRTSKRATSKALTEYLTSGNIGVQ